MSDTAGASVDTVYYCSCGFPSQRSACFGCWFVSESSHVLKLADRKSRLANSHRTSRTVKTAHIPGVKNPRRNRILSNLLVRCYVMTYISCVSMRKRFEMWLVTRGITEIRYFQNDLRAILWWCIAVTCQYVTRFQISNIRHCCQMWSFQRILTLKIHWLLTAALPLVLILLL